MIDAWPRIADVLHGVDCALMGGTGVAMILRHRKSFDLDFVTLKPFDSHALSARLLASAKHAAYREDDREHIAKVAFDGVPVTVMRDLRGVVQGHARDVQRGTTVDGIRIGSLPDLMAMKLDVIRERHQLRDYIDICEMDRTGACKIEDGLRYHRQRYSPTVSWEETTRVAEMATDPPRMASDPVFDALMSEVVAYLAQRRDEVMRWAMQSAERPRTAPTTTQRDEPPDPFPTLGMNPHGSSKANSSSNLSTARTSDATDRCNRWMPLAEARCIRPSGHSGSCRSGY